jgi:predicted RNA-binding protein YlxR (DUF448 family)/ribosomal protein L30E
MPRQQRPLRRATTPEDPAIADPISSSVEDDIAEDEPETGPLRRCGITRERMAKERMIRFVIGPDRQVVPDLAARLPGRGIWLSAQRDVLQAATQRGVFAKAARGPVHVPPDLLPVLQASLVRRIGELLGLARRAGQAVCGFQKAREILVTGRVGVVIEAQDGSPDEIARFLGGHAANIPVVQPLSGAELGSIFGRDHVVHVVVTKGRLAEKLTDEATRWAGLTTETAPIALRARPSRDKRPSVLPGTQEHSAPPDAKNVTKTGG